MRQLVRLENTADNSDGAGDDDDHNHDENGNTIISISATLDVLNVG